MSKVIVMVGPPGCGKTMTATQLEKYGVVRLCADLIRKELWGSESSQKEPDKVFEVFYKRLRENLEKGNDIVIDNTNCKPKYRKEIVSIVKEYSGEIEFWVLKTTLVECLKRNQLRDRKVPEDIIKIMYENLEKEPVIEGPVTEIYDSRFLPFHFKKPVKK